MTDTGCSRYLSISVMAKLARTTWSVDDRPEVIEHPETAKIIKVVPGVQFQVLVGENNGARSLFTGLLTLAPQAVYPLYARPCCEALMLVEGDAVVEVEDRRYSLGRLDAVTIVAGQPRRLVNRSTKQSTLFHVSLANSTLDQTWVNGRFTPVDQPKDAMGRAGTEWVSRNDRTKYFELAPRALFHDLFNADMGSQGICGGHGVFEPGARLPCHRHEFDESITIVQGRATCVVEGRRYDLAGNATALVPKGRCHYFINLTLEPMAMIWVYAGDRPDRIVMDEGFCHPDKAKAPAG
jgi:mannose-6-phosphate isomerase-like protein (cupin superfamily)